MEDSKNDFLLFCQQSQLKQKKDKENEKSGKSESKRKKKRKLSEKQDCNKISNIFLGTNRESNQKPQKRQKFCCPICGASVLETLINLHIDTKHNTENYKKPQLNNQNINHKSENIIEMQQEINEKQHCNNNNTINDNKQELSQNSCNDNNCENAQNLNSESKQKIHPLFKQGALPSHAFKKNISTNRTKSDKIPTQEMIFYVHFIVENNDLKDWKVEFICENINGLSLSFVFLFSVFVCIHTARIHIICEKKVTHTMVQKKKMKQHKICVCVMKQRLVGRS